MGIPAHSGPRGGREVTPLSNWFTLSVVGLALALFATSLAWAILHNLREGQAFRAQLARRLAVLRLERLMRMMGLDPGRYLHQQPIVDVERHMRACAQCPETGRCDQALEQHQPQAVADYCANYPDLRELRDKGKHLS
jgi:hypothetical protein